MRTLRSTVAALMLAVLIAGCTGIAVMPAKIVYMYPTGELFEQGAANGAVAKVDNGTLNLYLPMFSKDIMMPKRFQFSWDANEMKWKEARDGKAYIEVILDAREQTLSNGKTLHLGPDMILVHFPDEPKYGDLAGGMIWLVSNIGPEEFKKINGVYKSSTASYIDIFQQPGDVTNVLR